MATEQHLYRVVAQFEPGSSAQQVDRFFEGIAREIQELSGKQLRFGQVDPASLQRIQQSLQDAVRKGVTGGDAFRGMDKALQQQLLGASGSFSRFFTEQANVFARSIDNAVAQALRRAAFNKSGTAFVTSKDLGIPVTPQTPLENLYRVTAFDKEKATADEIAARRMKADRDAATAAGQYNAAVGKLNSAVEQEVQAHQKAAAAAERSARNAEVQRGRETVALERRRAADARAQEALFKAKMAESQSLLRSGLRFEGSGSRLSNAQERDAVLRSFADYQQVRFASPNTATAVGRVQEQVNQALLAQSRAARALRDEMAKAVPNLTALESAWNQQRRAGEQLAAAQTRLSILNAGPSPSGLFAQFQAGFRGQSDLPYAQQIGQAFKFSVFYGTAYKLLFAFTQTLQQTLQEGIEFQSAVSELKLATSQSAEHALRLANRLGEISADAGFAPSAGALAGARAIGLYGATQSDAATQNYIAEISTRVGSQLAFSSGMQMEDVQTRLAAITNAFRLGPAGQERVADLDAFYAKRFGVAPGATIRTVAEVGSVGQSAGFNLEQVNALAALIMGRTGQTDSAVAGQLAQIFSRGGEGSLTAVASRYNIDSQQTLAEQMRQLAEVYRTASPAEQNQIAAAFGRGRVQNTISILLGSFDDVTKAAQDAANGMADGAADEAFTERMNNIGGQIQLLLGDLKEFANQLGQSGVLATLGLAVEVLDKLLEAGTDLLRLWNELPGGVRAVIASLALLALAARTSAGASLVSGAVGGAFVGRAGGRLAINAAGPGAAGAVPLASRAGLNAAAGVAGSALLAAGPWAAALGGLYALGELQGAARSLKDGMLAAREALAASTEDLSSPDQVIARADQLRDQAKDLEPKGFWQEAYTTLINTGLADSMERQRAELEAEAQRLDRYAPHLRRALDSGEAPAAFPLDSQGMTETLDTMTRAGATANERFAALADALLGTAGAAEAATRAFSPEEFSGRVAPALSTALGKEGAPLAGFDRLDGSYAGPAVSPTEIENALKDRIAALGIKSENLTPAQLTALSAGLIDQLMGYSEEDVAGFSAEASEFRQTMIDIVVDSLRGQISAVRELLDQNRRLTNEEMTTAINGLVQEARGRLDLLPSSDLRGRIAILRELGRSIRASISRQREDGGEVGPAVLAALNQAERDLVSVEFERLENLRKVAQQGARSRAEAARIGETFLRREVARAIAAGANGADVLAQIIANSGDAAVRITRSAVQAALKVARQALSSARTMGAYSAGQGFSSPQLQAAQDRVAGLQKLLGVVNTTPNDGEEGLGGYATDFPGYEPPPAPDVMTDEERKRLAEERRRRLLSIRSSLRHLAIDLSNPLAEARVAVADALDQVRNAVDRESRLAARVDLRRARIELEATKFQQRLQAVQTAEELGRISHLKYLNYLDKERDRLSAIKKRTFQQQQQLDEVERLLKGAADSMQGQWNFGDIKLPTPYEVRRRVEELYGPAVRGYGGVMGSPNDVLPRGASTSIQHVTFQVNGADVAMVRQIVREYVGSATSVRTTTPRHR